MSRSTPDPHDSLYERAEHAAARGVPLDEALQAVRDGYSSVAADLAIADDLGEES